MLQPAVIYMVPLQPSRNPQSYFHGALQTCRIFSFSFLTLLSASHQSWASDTVSLKSLTEGAKSTYNTASDAIGTAARSAYEAEVEIKGIVEAVGESVGFIFFAIVAFVFAGIAIAFFLWFGRNSAKVIVWLSDRVGISSRLARFSNSAGNRAAKIPQYAIPLAVLTVLTLVLAFSK